jgi:transposase
MAVADHAGLPVAVSIASGSRHDVSLVDDVLDEAFLEELPPKLIADKGFDSAPLAERLERERDIELIAPKRGGKHPSRRKQDGRPLRRYKRRWKVERLFAWLKRYRRVTVRWDNKAENYLGFIHLACMVLLLRHL